jgi:hypothetical protein
MEQNVLSVVVVIVPYLIVVGNALFTQLDNIVRKEYIKVIKFCIVILLGVITSVSLKFVHFIDFDFIQNMTYFETIFFGLFLGFGATGTFDTIINIKNKPINE